jgi:lipopolysaccharide export system permease protein
LIIRRYLIREISRPLALILGILVVLFGSYSASDFLSDAVNGLVPTNMLMEMVGLKVLIALDVLIPISLYLSVLLAFGRLYGDSEITALFALRIPPGWVVRAVLTLACFLAVVVGFESLVLRPMAYETLHELSNQAESMLNIDAMEAGTFYLGEQGRRVIFLTQRAGPGAPARDVFVRLKYPDHTEIIYAKLAAKLPGSHPGNGSDVHLSDVHLYNISNNNLQSDQALNAQDFIVNTKVQAAAPPGYSAVAASTAQLAASRNAADVAELQWRLSTPVSTLLLGLLGIPMSRAKPRQGKYTKFGAAILIYALYYLLCTSARAWVQNGDVPSFPGLWWAPGLLALFLLVSFYWRTLVLKFAQPRETPRR